VSDYTEGVTSVLEGLCSREGKVGDGFFLVIRIARWESDAHWECTLEQ